MCLGRWDSTLKLPPIAELWRHVFIQYEVVKDLRGSHLFLWRRCFAVAGCPPHRAELGDGGVGESGDELCRGQLWGLEPDSFGRLFFLA